MLLLVDQNTKRIIRDWKKGMCEGGTKTSINTRECRVRGSGRDFHRDGACVSVGVSVDEIKVSLLLRGLIIIMTVQNDTFHLCLGTKLAMTSVALLLVLLSVFFFSLLPWYCLFCFAMVVKLPSS